MGLLIEVTDVSVPDADPEQLWGRHIDFPVLGSQTEAFAFDVAGCCSRSRAARSPNA